MYRYNFLTIGILPIFADLPEPLTAAWGEGEISQRRARSGVADGAEEGDWTESAANLSRARRRRDLEVCIVMTATMPDYSRGQ